MNEQAVNNLQELTCNKTQATKPDYNSKIQYILEIEIKSKKKTSKYIHGTN